MLRLLITAIALVALTACQQANPGSTASMQTGEVDPGFLLTSRGDYVVSNAPPGIEVTVGLATVRRSDSLGRVEVSPDPDE